MSNFEHALYANLDLELAGISTPRQHMQAATVLLRLAAESIYRARGIALTPDGSFETINWMARSMAALSDRIDRRQERDRTRAVPNQFTPGSAR